MGSVWKRKGAVPPPPPSPLHAQLNHTATLNAFVKRIRLPRPRIDLKPGTLCSVVGWGDISNYDERPIQLMEANTTIVKRSLCRTLWKGRVSGNMLCGASRNATLQGVCAVSATRPPQPSQPPRPVGLLLIHSPLQGDSGGPLVFKGKVYGVVSFSGERCGDRRYPDIYTRISNYIDWVHHVVLSHRQPPGQRKDKPGPEKAGGDQGAAGWGRPGFPRPPPAPRGLMFNGN